MKNMLSLSLVLSILVLSSCGVNHALIVNHNSNTTQVVLSANNFKVVEKVSGSAEVNYVLMIGGINQTQLYENAYSAMVNKANLSGAKALTNIITEEHIGGFPPFFFKRTITVSAQVIEFTR
jgi:hypothetical protein